MKKFLVSSLLLVSSSMALAIQSPAFSISPVADKALSGQHLLRLKVQDTQPKSGICTYFVKQLQYLPALQVLNVEVYQEPCLNDSYGVSKGEVDWVAPTSLLSRGQELHVLVNQGKVGVLVYDDVANAFRIKN